MKLKIVNVSFEPKAMFNFGGIEVVFVEIRPKKLMNKIDECHLDKCVHTLHQPVALYLLMKLKIVNVSFELKAMFNFGGIEVVFVEIRPKKLMNLSLNSKSMKVTWISVYILYINLLPYTCSIGYETRNCEC